MTDSTNFCAQTQTEFLHMGCGDRGFSSDQCMARAFDYASKCVCEHRECATASQIVYGSALGSIATVLATYLIHALCARASCKRRSEPSPMGEFARFSEVSRLSTDGLRRGSNPQP